MPDKIHETRPVFFVSNSTGITVETLGRSLLYQFSTFRFESHSLRYIDTNEKAVEARDLINKMAAECGKRPIILSTMINRGLRDIISSAEGLYLDIFDAFISPLEMELGSEAMLGMGHSHGIQNDDYYSERIDAVNYSLKTDDGIGAKQYFKADVILTGVSRSGKTPTSLYLAMHYGLCAANYPLVEDELEQITLPAILQEYRTKLFGLLITPERLHSIRSKRKPDSDYASLSRCRYEVRQTETMFQHENIPYFDVSSMSIEEIASTIMSMLNLSPRTFVP